MIQKTYQVTTAIWLYPGKAGWHFVTIPTDVTQDIDYYFSLAKKGWGSLPVKVAVGLTSWETSIFPDKKNQTYLLPMKAAVRQAENLHEGQEITLILEIKS